MMVEQKEQFLVENLVVKLAKQKVFLMVAQKVLFLADLSD
jgi:hypothetical protein